jgi:hypothetical protein
MFQAYQDDCLTGCVAVGHSGIWDTIPTDQYPKTCKYVINFVTMDPDKQCGDYEIVRKGLEVLRTGAFIRPHAEATTYAN